MPHLPRVVLRRNKSDAVRRFHPWIFSGAIASLEDEVRDGAWVAVYGDTGEFLATGHYGSGSIAVKILSFQPISDLAQFYLDRIQSAFELRRQLGLVSNFETTCYRLVNSEGDGLPGLIIDWYDGVAVVQAHSQGMYQQRDLVASALQQVYGENLKAIYDKSATILGKQLPAGTKNEHLLGSAIEGSVLEHGHKFAVNWEEGQKTGLFLDQRENRWLLTRYVKDKKVLNAFCYSAGFSAYAAAAKARVVHSVDSSAKIMSLALRNVEMNNPTNVAHEFFTQDVFDFLKHCDEDYDVIVLDPPAFAKGLSARHQAMMAYKRLNHQALSRLQAGGILFTFSCSQVVGVEHFQGAVTAAAIESGREIRILHQVTQPADHPQNIFHSEGLYLKGLVLQVQ